VRDDLCPGLAAQLAGPAEVIGMALYFSTDAPM
jgi:hypothetical protein